MRYEEQQQPPPTALTAHIPSHLLTLHHSHLSLPLPISSQAGVQRRIQCLKYLVLANMLMNSDISPFDSQVRV